jgi:hypothetical protein
LLWGSGGNKEAEREDLRASLGISDTSALRDPDLRNDFEHFDSRLEDWLTESQGDSFVGRNVGPVTMFPGLDPSKRFHHFDPETGIVTFWQHSVSLPAILAEVRTLFPRAQAAAEQASGDDQE